MEIPVPGEKVAWGRVCSECSVSVSKSWTRGLWGDPGEGGGCTSPPGTSYRNLPIHVLVIYLSLSVLSLRSLSCEEQMRCALGRPACRTA